MSFAVPIWPIIEIVWSMPPQAVPANLSAAITSSASVVLSNSFSRLLEWSVMTAAQTQNELDDERPAAGGT